MSISAFRLSFAHTGDQAPVSSPVLPSVLAPVLVPVPAPVLAPVPDPAPDPVSVPVPAPPPAPVLDLAPFAASFRARSNLAFLLRAVVGVWLYVFSVGCASAPDPSAFAKATRSLATSVRALGAETEQQLAISKATQRVATDFERQWAARNHAMRAASDYSQSLVKVFSEAHATQPASLSRNLQSLAHSLGVGGSIDSGTAAMGAGMGVGVGVLAATADTVAFLHAQIALIQASHNLEEAMTRAQPVIDRIAQLIVADTGDLETIIRASAVLQRLDLAENFNEPLAFAESVDRRLSEIRRLSYGELTPGDLDELTRIAALKASIATDLAPYFAQVSTINQREADALEAIRSTRVAIESWAKSHQTLALTVRTSTPPDTTQLIEAIANLNALLIRWRAV